MSKIILPPIYRSEAEFVVVLLGRDYPNRIWTKFESEQFKERFGDKRVIPVWFADTQPGLFDLTSQVGGIKIDRSEDITGQLEKIRDLLLKKLIEFRVEPLIGEEPESPLLAAATDEPE